MKWYLRLSWGFQITLFAWIDVPHVGATNELKTENVATTTLVKVSRESTLQTHTLFSIISSGRPQKKDCVILYQYYWIIPEIYQCTAETVSRVNPLELKLYDMVCVAITLYYRIFSAYWCVPTSLGYWLKGQGWDIKWFESVKYCLIVMKFCMVFLRDVLGVSRLMVTCKGQMSKGKQGQRPNYRTLP